MAAVVVMSRLLIGLSPSSGVDVRIWALVKLGDTLGMLIWLETINGMLCCFGGYTDK